jgi:SecD/SecF fusion protein
LRFVAIAVFMALYYLLPGVISVIALGLYVLFATAIFKSLGVTFSLPAIAGIILSIGMAIDANILIFERLKEELRLGKTLLAGLDAAFKRAFPAIFDSNLSTILICLILYYFGTGPVQGFATTLGTGVAISFFTAIFCTRAMLYTLVGLGVHPSERLFGLRRQLGQEVGEQLGAAKDRFDFVNKRGLYYAISGVAILIGLVFWFGLGGLKPGIDFAGGSELVLQRPVPGATQPKIEQPPAATQGNQQQQPPAQGEQAQQQPPAQGEQAQQPPAATQGNQQQQPTPPAALPEPINANLAQVLSLLRQAGFEKVGALFGEGNRQLIVHVADADADSQQKIVDALKPLGELQVVSFASISPRVREETVQRAVTAVMLSLIAILIYIAIRFSIEGGWSGFKFGIAATLALAHDVLIMVGGAAVLGYLLGWEINALFITALLTLVGFSINDTIVVYDRVRENLRQRARGETFATIVNRSLNQTLARSINTSLTLLLVLVALVIWGAVTQDLRFFYVAMLIGVIAGTYSSIFIASQIMVDWQDAREKLHQRQAEAAKATAVAPKPSGASTPTAAPTASSADRRPAQKAPRAACRQAQATLLMPIQRITPEADERVKRRALLAVFITIFVSLVGFGIVIPLLPFYAQRFKASELQIGLLFASFSVAQLVAAPILGDWSDRWGRRPVLILSLLGSAASFVMLALAPNLFWLFLSRLLDGFTGGNITTARAYIADISPPERRARNFGLIGAAFGLGFILGPALGGGLASFGLAVSCVGGGGDFAAGGGVCVRHAA